MQTRPFHSIIPAWSMVHEAWRGGWWQLWSTLVIGTHENKETSALVTLSVEGKTEWPPGKLVFLHAIFTCHLKRDDHQFQKLWEQLIYSDLRHDGTNPQGLPFKHSIASSPLSIASLCHSCWPKYIRITFLLRTGLLFCSYPYSFIIPPPKKNQSLEKAFTWEQVSNSPSWYCPEWNL